MYQGPIIDAHHHLWDLSLGRHRWLTDPEVGIGALGDISFMRHTYLPADRTDSPVHRVALEAFETIAKEGRKYGVCLVVVSQRPSDVSRTILSQCNNFVIMRLTNDQDQDVVSRVVPGTAAGITGLLPLLDVGEAIVVGDALLLPLRIQLDVPDSRPASSTLPYWSMWANHASSYDAIAAGVGALRQQWRGD